MTHSQTTTPKKGLINKLPSLLIKVLALICLFILIFIAAVPLDIIAQLSLSIGVVVLVYAASSESLERTQKRVIFRFFAIVFGCLLSIRYLIWRGVYTLDATDIFSLIAMWTLFAAEIYSGAIQTRGAAGVSHQEELDTPSGGILP